MSDQPPVKPDPAAKRTTVSLKLPASLDEALIDEARLRQVSKSELVREAISHYLGHDPDDPPPGSFLAAAKDLAGCLEADPDLSTRDLEGYGE